MSVYRVHRGLRGGSCLNVIRVLRTPFLVKFEPGVRFRYVGFRLVVKRRSP